MLMMAKIFYLLWLWSYKMKHRGQEENKSNSFRMVVLLILIISSYNKLFEHLLGHDVQRL